MSDEKVDSTSDERTVNNLMRHQYRVLTAEEKLAVAAIKEHGQWMLEAIDRFVHPSREASLAKTKVEECVMWAVKGITG